MSGADSAAGWKALAELQYQNRCPRVLLNTLLVVSHLFQLQGIYNLGPFAQPFSRPPGNVFPTLMNKCQPRRDHSFLELNACDQLQPGFQA